MNNAQRGVYQPLVENVSVYDLSEEDQDQERSRLPLLIVIAGVIAAAFFGVVWIAYNQGLAHGRASVALVAAPEGPVRTAPQDAATGTTPFTNLKIYNIPVPPDEEAKGTTLAAEPQVATTEAPPARLEPAPLPKTAPASAPQKSGPRPAAQAKIAGPGPQTKAAAAEPAETTSPQSVAHPATLLAAPALEPLTKAETNPAKLTPPASGQGAAMLQIGAYESSELANAAFATFKARYGSTLGDVNEDIQKVDLGAKGTWYRLRLGPYATRTEATAMCQSLKAKGATCFLASR